MDSVYAETYPELYRRHWWWRVREGILLRRIAGLLEKKERPVRILDVGCGAGLFFDALQRFGDVEGIESDPRAVERAGRWRESIHQGELDESFRPTELYDAILMLDILEHLRDPVRLLRSARPLLKPDGRIVITVPAFNWLWTRHDDLNHHVCRYTGAQMRHTVRAAGLVVTDSTYLFQSLVVPKALVRLQESLLSKAPSVPTIPGRALNDALQSWFRTEYAVARWLPFGTSLMVVAKSPS
ncbi:MAG TPA: class I SAM-dependent methyltransferase [Vicinamibacterales bacterium]|nr:class I SAM-dependent methyltransferase [Vicinamibacterales bacterium]